MNLKKTLLNIRNNPKKSFVQGTFIEARPEQDNQLGSIFVLSEVNQAERLDEKIIYVITQLLEKNYFLNENIFLSNQINSLKIESIFEASLVKTNQELLEFIDQEKINFKFKNLNITVGLIFKNQIHFSNLGQNKAFLIKKNQENLQVSDINPDDDEQNLEDISAGKIFSSIISGEIPQDSYIIFSNASLSEYLLNDDFIKILEDLKLEGATEQIKNLLNKINNYSNFTGVFLKNTKPEFEKQPEPYYSPSLTETEKKTEELLNNTGTISKDSIKKVFKIFNIFKILKKPYQALIKKLKRKKEKPEKLDLSITKPRKSKTKKILLILIVALLLVLLLKLYFQRNKNENIIQEKNSSDIEEQIKQKQNQIDSSLLYNNEERAREIIEELDQLMKSLSPKEKNKIKNYEELEESLNEQIRQIQKMILISDPLELGNFSTLKNEANPVALVRSIKNNKIYSLDPQNNTIYSLDLNNRVLSTVNDNELLKGEKAFSSSDSQDNSYFLVNNQLITINSEEKISFNTINVDNPLAIESLGIYNNRPYLINKESNNIIRYSKSGNTFTSPLSWLKEDPGFKLKDIAIDFSIYILDDNGQVFKFLEGRKENFSLDVISPKSEANKIALSQNYILTLDQKNQRVILYNREDGKFINQYYSDKFNDLKDFIINESEKKVYLLNNTSVYELDLAI